MTFVFNIDLLFLRIIRWKLYKEFLSRNKMLEMWNYWFSRRDRTDSHCLNRRILLFKISAWKMFAILWKMNEISILFTISWNEIFFLMWDVIYVYFISYQKILSPLLKILNIICNYYFCYSLFREVLYIKILTDIGKINFRKLQITLPSLNFVWNESFFYVDLNANYIKAIISENYLLRIEVSVMTFMYDK